jgi:hypothetical protein
LTWQRVGLIRREKGCMAPNSEFRIQNLEFRRMLAAILIAAVLPSTLVAEGFWVKKAYQEWSARECEKILNDSPWAKSRTMTAVFVQPQGQPSVVPGRDSIPQITYVARLWSALPVRQAAVRRMQLDPEFSRMPDQVRKSAETRQTSVLGEKFPEHIVIRVEYSTTVTGYQRELAHYWQTRPAELWKQDVFLNTSSGRIAPVDIRVASGGGGSFELLFPREINGEPVVKPTDKSFNLDFQAPAIGAFPSERVLLEFKLKDMMMGGEPAF